MGLKIDAFKNILKNISFQALVNDGDKTLNLMKMKKKTTAFLFLLSDHARIYSA